MRLIPTLILLLITTQLHAQALPAKPVDRGTDVGLPPEVTTPAPNIKLDHLQYVIPGAEPDSVVDYPQLLALQEAMREVAKADLAGAKARFGVRGMFALTPNAPARFKMQVGGNPAGEDARLMQFHHDASALTGFHSTKGTIYVTFDYAVNP
jgi:hypothetical protein